MPHLNVLIVEDNPIDAELIELELGKGGFEFNSERVETADEMREALQRREWDIVLSDYTMPVFSATQALEVVRRSGLDLPFIVVSGTIGEETAVAAMRSGVSDYLIKGNLARLAPAVRRELEGVNQRRAKREAEENSRSIEARFRAIIEKSFDVVTLVDATGVVRYISPGCENVIGVKPDDYVGRTVFESCHPSEVASHNALFQELLKKPGSTIESTGRCLHADGTIRDVESTFTNLLDDPDVRAVVINTRDVSERERARAEVERGLAQMRAVVASMTEGVIIADPSGNLLNWNATALRILGFEREEEVLKPGANFTDQFEVSLPGGQVIP